MNKNKLDILTVSKSPKFRKFYKLLCKLTGLKLILVDVELKKRIVLGYSRKKIPLCSSMRRHDRFAKQCQQCEREHCAIAHRKRKGHYYKCHAGLIDIVVPLFIGERHVGTFLGGQVLAAPPTEANFNEFSAELKQYDFDLDALKKEYFQMPYMDASQLETAFELITLMAEHFYELGSRLIEEPVKNSAVNIACEFIQKHFQEPLVLDDIAEAVGLAPAYLCSLFKKEKEIGLINYIQQIRVEYVCKLLKTTTYPISRIALEAGFGSLAAFNRAFRRQTGMTPRLYRKE